LDNTVLFSDHARKRCAQRNITEDNVMLAIEHGKLLINAGSYVFFLGKRHIARAGLPQSYYRLEGLTVHASKGADGKLCIITVYRHKDGLKRNRRKGKHDLRRGDAA